MAERNVQVDHVTIWRWIQRYAPELSQRCRSRLRMTNGSWGVDETYFAWLASGLPTSCQHAKPKGPRLMRRAGGFAPATPGFMLCGADIIKP
jgi:hypothetical protein